MVFPTIIGLGLEDLQTSDITLGHSTCLGTAHLQQSTRFTGFFIIQKFRKLQEGFLQLYRIKFLKVYITAILILYKLKQLKPFKCLGLTCVRPLETIWGQIT